MSHQNTFFSFVRKYGTAANAVAYGVLNVVAPGSGNLIDMASKAVDVAQELAEDMARDQNTNREIPVSLS